MKSIQKSAADEVTEQIRELEGERKPTPDHPTRQTQGPPPFFVRYRKAGPNYARLQIFLNSYKNVHVATTATRLNLVEGIRQAFKHFEESGGDGHLNPPWVLATVRGAMAMIIDHDPKKALDLAQESLYLSRAGSVSPEETFWQEAIAYNNMSEASRYLGDFDQAIRFAIESLRLDPRSQSFWTTLVLALIAKARDSRIPDGDRESFTNAARLALRKVLERIEQPGESDVWSKYLRAYADEFGLELAMEKQDMPELVELFERLVGTFVGPGIWCASSEPHGRW